MLSRSTLRLFVTQKSEHHRYIYTTCTTHNNDVNRIFLKDKPCLTARQYHKVTILQYVYVFQFAKYLNIWLKSLWIQRMSYNAVYCKDDNPKLGTLFNYMVPIRGIMGNFMELGIGVYQCLFSPAPKHDTHALQWLQSAKSFDLSMNSRERETFFEKWTPLARIKTFHTKRRWNYSGGTHLSFRQEFVFVNFQPTLSLIFFF